MRRVSLGPGWPRLIFVGLTLTLVLTAQGRSPAATEDPPQDDPPIVLVDTVKSLSGPEGTNQFTITRDGDSLVITNPGFTRW